MDIYKLPDCPIVGRELELCTEVAEVQDLPVIKVKSNP